MNGSVFKRKLKSGTTWCYSFLAGRDQSGKRINAFKSGYETKAAAEQAPAQVDPTFSEYIRYWLKEHARETRLNDLTTAQIQPVVHRLSDSGGMATEEHPNAGRWRPRRCGTSACFSTPAWQKRIGSAY